MKSRKEARKAVVKNPTNTSGNHEPHPNGPTVEEIRLRAYEIYLERGRTEGQHLEDWFQAEKELTENIQKRHSD